MNVLKAIKKRRSVRDYDPDKQITNDNLNILLDAAKNAPVGKGIYRDLHLSVLQSTDVIKKIISKCSNSSIPHLINPFYNAPTIIAICQRNFDKFAPLCYQNAGCIGQTIMLAATSLKIDSIYIYGIVPKFIEDKTGELTRLLKTPNDEFVPVAFIALGYNLDDTKKKFDREISWNIV
jgi:nitroreductase